MSWQALNWATQQRTGDVGLKTILLLMANYADEDNSCFPSQARLAEQSEQSERTIRRQVQALEERGYLTRERRTNSHGHRASDRYVLHVDGPPANLSGRQSYRPTETGPTGQLRQSYRPMVAGTKDTSVDTPKDTLPDAYAPEPSEPALDAGNDGLFSIKQESRGEVEKHPGKQADPVNTSARALADAYYEATDKMANWNAAFAIAKKALRAGHLEPAIRDAMLRLASYGWTLTGEKLRAQLRGGPQHPGAIQREPTRDKHGRIVQYD